MKTKTDTKRLGKLKLTRQDSIMTSQGTTEYWWYGDKRINITLTSRGKEWKLAIEFFRVSIEWVMRASTEDEIRREFRKGLRSLKRLIAGM